MKQLIIIASLGLIMGGFILPVPATAQGLTEYKLLAPLPGVTTEANPENSTAATYIPGIVKLIIGMAGVLAVLKIIVGGIQYMSTDAFNQKNEAKSTISNALWGLMLVISSWIILYTINPNLIKFDLSIDRLEVGEGFDLEVGPHGPNVGEPWHDDSGFRMLLENIEVNGTSMVKLNKPNCETIGQSSCTSVFGLNPAITAKLEEMIEGCADSMEERASADCKVIISGGTEYWLHGNRNTNIDTNNTRHKPGGAALDISQRSTFITRFLTAGTEILRNSRGIQKVSGTGCAPGDERYTYKNVLFVNEGSKSTEGIFPEENVSPNSGATHWHVCF